MRTVLISLLLLCSSLPSVCWGKPNDGIQDGVQVWGYEHAEPCPASEALCSAWVDFRLAHPWPYQSFAVGWEEGSGEAVVIISEPPPVATRRELDKLVRVVFGRNLAEVVRLRWPTGLNGWLEDLVLRVEVPDGAQPIPVVQGDQFAAAEVPDFLFSRIYFLYEFFHRTPDGFYVDILGGSGPPEERRGIVNIEISPSDVDAWLTNDSAKWTDLQRGSRTQQLVWRTLRSARKAGAFLGPDSALVALVAPKGVALETLAVHFRRFAVASDLIVAALQPKTGGFILLGRARQVPFDVLPPLRFETFARLAANKSAELHQSYERQRLFAGKILTGTHAGWDWAPIALSAQLEDGEFGTLLNLADQVLKSWSEKGDVQYFAFDYTPPERFPFDKLQASAHFSQALGTDSLVYNWNTNGFATITELPVGRVMTTARSGALPVLYIPGGSGLAALSDLKPDDPITESYELVLERRERVAGESADRAYDYFVSLGDPILVRTVQNAFLYQAVTNFLEVSSTAGWRTKQQTARSDAVAKVLRNSASEWLSSAMGEPPYVSSSRAAKLIASAMKRPGMTHERLAELLATPQAATQRLIALDAELRRRQGQGRALWAAGLQAAAEFDEAFEQYCAAVLQTGGRRYQLGSGERCEEGSSSPPANVIAAREAAAAARGKYERLEASWKQSEKALGATYQQAKILDEDLRAAANLGREAGVDAALYSDLDQVLASVLGATRDLESTTSVQTPTVVLSQNRTQIWTIGGHNLDSEAVRVRISDDVSSPTVELDDGKTTLVVPHSDLGRANWLALAVERGNPLPEAPAGGLPPPPRDIRPALHLPGPDDKPPADKLLAVGAPDSQGSHASSDTLLGAMRREVPVNRTEILARAESCNCDVYVEQVNEAVFEVIRTGPPPRSRTVLGDFELVDALASMRGADRTRVRYAGFATAEVENIERSAQLASQRNAGRPKGNRVQDWLSAGTRLFGSEREPRVPIILKVQTRGGKTEHLSIYGTLPKEARGNWSTAKFLDVTDAAILDGARGAGYSHASDSPTATAVVALKFPGSRPTELQTLGVLVEVSTQNTAGLAARLKQTVLQGLAGLKSPRTRLDIALAQLKTRIDRALKPEEVYFLINSLGDATVAELHWSRIASQHTSTKEQDDL